MSSVFYQQPFQYLIQILRRLRFGMVWWLRGVSAKDLDAFYQNPDAHHLGRWNNDRFETLCKVIDQRIGDVQTIVDVGCHEGRCLRYLAEHSGAQSLVGLDASERVIDRAKVRCEGLPIRFQRFDLNRLYADPEGAHMPLSAVPDVLVLCEVMYYVGPASYRRWKSSKHDLDHRQRLIQALARHAAKAVIFQHFGRREREAIGTAVVACGGELVDRQWGIYVLKGNAARSGSSAKN